MLLQWYVTGLCVRAVDGVFKSHGVRTIRLQNEEITCMEDTEQNGDSKVDVLFVPSNAKEDIEQKAIKMQEPPPPKEVKALPIPPEASGKRRGGRRLRKMKERFGMTQMRQLTNRVQFGQEEDKHLSPSSTGAVSPVPSPPPTFRLFA